MLLLELLIKKSRSDDTRQWIILKGIELEHYPRYSDSVIGDFKKVFLDKGDDDINAGSKAYKQRYEGTKAIFAIDYAKQVIELDMTKYSGNDSRRYASKIGVFKKTKDVYPVISSDVAFNRVVDLLKALQALVKEDTKIGKFKLVGDDRVEGMTVAEALADGLVKYDYRKIFDSSTKTLTLFHGTSEKRAKKALKEGLKSGQRETIYFDLIDGYSTRNVYLSFNPATAASYATREAINDGSAPAILEISLTRKEFERLRSDEDSMHWFNSLPENYQKKFLKDNPLIDAIWGGDFKGFTVHIKNLNHKEGKFGLMWLRNGSAQKDFAEHAAKQFEKFGLVTDAQIEEAEIQTFMNLMKTFTEATFNKSIKEAGNVAYPGTIPASQLKLFKTWTLKGAKIEGNGDNKPYKKADYDASIDKQNASVKRY